jgi:hypothetical protein
MQKTSHKDDNNFGTSVTTINSNLYFASQPKGLGKRIFFGMNTYSSDIGLRKFLI